MGCFRFFRIQTGFNIFPNLLGGFDPLGTNSSFGLLWTALLKARQLSSDTNDPR